MEEEEWIGIGFFDAVALVVVDHHHPHHDRDSRQMVVPWLAVCARKYWA